MASRVAPPAALLGATPPPAGRRRTAADRSATRMAVRLASINALVWALGNGLVSTTLVVYLALALGAEGLAISGVIAAPRVAGVLRLGAPAVVARAALLRFGKHSVGRKGVCLAGYGASCVALAVPPAVAVAASRDPMSLAWCGGPLAALVAAWCLYHVIEYFATVALWSWLGDVYPRPLRSRLLGRRERWLTVGRVLGIGASVLVAEHAPRAIEWAAGDTETPRWAPLALSAALGAVAMLAAVVPLAAMNAFSDRPSAVPAAPWRTLLAALAERPYRRLLAYTCWFGFANGLTGSAQSMFPERVLGVGYSASTLMQAGMRAGQAAIAPASGAWIARVGPRPVLFVAQLLVALGPLCFWAPTTWENLSRATKSCPITPGVMCVGFAFVLWIAYAPLNVALDGLKIGLADPRNNSPYVAVHHALSDLVNAATILAGGLLYDTLAAGDAQSLRAYGALFLAGWACRALAAPLALRLDPRREKP